MKRFACGNARASTLRMKRAVGRRRSVERAWLSGRSCVTSAGILMYDSRYRDDVQARIDANAVLTPEAICLPPWPQSFGGTAST